MRRRLPAIALIWFAADAAVLACPVCFQFEDGATTAGVRAALVVLLSVTVAVLAAVAVWVKGSGLFSTDLARSVPDLEDLRPGTTTARSVEKRPDPL